MYNFMLYSILVKQVMGKKHLELWREYSYLGQLIFEDIVPHLSSIQLRVESCPDHRHDVIHAARLVTIGQQVTTNNNANNS